MTRVHILRFVFLIVAVLGFGASRAEAQDERRLGVVVAYPASVGVQWQAARKVAVRFETDYSQFTNEATSEFTIPRFVPGLPLIPESIDVTTTTRSRNFEFGVSILYDLHRSDDLRVYVAPRFAINFGHTSFETEFNGDPAILAAVTFAADSDTSSESPGGGVSLGASHDLSARFRVFGEAGFNYLRGNFSGAASRDLKSSSFGIRGGVGAVILF